MCIEFKGSYFYFLLAFVFLGCAPTPFYAPEGTVPLQKEIPEHAFGGWINVYSSSSPEVGMGEFLGMRQDSIFLLKDEFIRGYSVSEIESARLIFYNTRAKSFAGWTAVNSVLSISNGFFMALTLPTNLIVGLSETKAESEMINFLEYPLWSWESLNYYSRFPQGLANIDLSQLGKEQ